MASVVLNAALAPLYVGDQLYASGLLTGGGGVSSKGPITTTGAFTCGSPLTVAGQSQIVGTVSVIGGTGAQLSLADTAGNAFDVVAESPAAGFRGTAFLQQQVLAQAGPPALPAASLDVAVINTTVGLVGGGGIEPSFSTYPSNFIASGAGWAPIGTFEGTLPAGTGAPAAIACAPIRATSQVDLFLYAFTAAAAAAGVVAPAVVITAGTGFTLNAQVGTSWRWRVLL